MLRVESIANIMIFSFREIPYNKYLKIKNYVIHLNMLSDKGILKNSQYMNTHSCIIRILLSLFVISIVFLSMANSTSVFAIPERFVLAAFRLESFVLAATYPIQIFPTIMLHANQYSTCTYWSCLFFYYGR